MPRTCVSNSNGHNQIRLEAADGGKLTRVTLAVSGLTSPSLESAQDVGPVGVNEYVVTTVSDGLVSLDLGSYLVLNGDAAAATELTLTSGDGYYDATYTCR